MRHRITDMIKIASINDKNEIMTLIKAAIEEMNTNNIDQWDEIYPNTSIIENDLYSNALYKYEDNGNITAIITIDEQGSPEYDEIKWSDTSGNFIVIHRLTVHPDYQGRGIAKTMMKFSEELPLQNAKSSIRLDAFTKNQYATNLYKCLEYDLKGTVQFRKGIFYCFEKLINPIDSRKIENV